MTEFVLGSVDPVNQCGMRGVALRARTSVTTPAARSVRRRPDDSSPGFGPCLADGLDFMKKPSLGIRLAAGKTSELKGKTSELKMRILE